MIPPQTDLAVTERPIRALVGGDETLARLLIIATDAPLVAEHYLAKASAARQAGYDVRIAAPVHQIARPEEVEALRTIQASGLAFHALPAGRGNATVLGGYALLRTLARLVRALRPALVHCIGLGPMIYGGAVARAKGLPAVHAAANLSSVIIGNDTGASLRSHALRRALAHAFGNRRAYITVDSADERTILSRLGVVDPKRTLLLHGEGVDIKVFHPRSEDEPSRRGQLIVVCAALPDAFAGASAFVSIARRMRARGASLRFVLLGASGIVSSGCIPEVEISRWSSDSNVEWWGDSRNRAAALREADVFCLPSPHHTGASKVLIEAAASGLPIVAADSPSSRKVVRHGRNGFLVPARNEVALEAELSRLTGDAAFRQRAGSQSREIAIAEFSHDAAITAALAVYRVAIGHTLVEAPLDLVQRHASWTRLIR